MSKNRYVLDANLIVSAALLPQSPSRQAFDKAIQIGVILMSQSMLEEIHQVLQRPKFDRYVTQAERLEFLTTLVASVERIDNTESIAVCHDPKDDKYLEAGLSGKANAIITGDDDLLTLNPFRGIQIISPRTFLDSHSIVSDEKDKD